MLKYEIDMKGNVNLVASGNDSILFADAMCLIRHLYDHIRLNDPRGAEKFIQLSIKMLSDRSGPLYTTEVING